MTLVKPDHNTKMNTKEDDLNASTVSNVDLCKFMQQISMTMEKLTTEIRTEIKGSNDKLGKEIRDCRDDMKTEIRAVNSKIERVEEVTKKLKNTTNQMKAETNGLRDELRRGKEEERVRIDKLEKRIEDIAVKNDKVTNVNLDFQPAGIGAGRTESVRGGERQTNAKDDSNVAMVINTPVPAIQPGGSTYADKAALTVTTEKIEFKSAWARLMSQSSLESQLQQVSAAADRLEKGEKVEPPVNTKKKLKLGNSIDLHDQNDWDWEEGEDDWDGVEERKSRNEEKKRVERERRRIKIEKAAFVGQCTIGLGPIKQESYDYFNKITGDFEEAKKMAAAEFLTGYLRYNHDDLSDTDITDTRISPKDDDILYIVMDSPEKVRNIRRRIADCRNMTVKTREYIPPQFFQRYTALSRFARDLRSSDSSLKTQIRFTKDDIRLWTKTKGTDDQFAQMEMEEVEKMQKLPKIEHNAPWRKKQDHPRWRRISPSKEKVVLRSLAGVCTDDSRVKSPSRLEDKQRQRVRSVSQEETNASSKKKRLTADSSSSDGSSSSSNDESPSTGKNSADKSMEVE